MKLDDFFGECDPESPAAFGRLCVETVGMASCWEFIEPSRLRAAVC